MILPSWGKLGLETASIGKEVSRFILTENEVFWVSCTCTGPNSHPAKRTWCLLGAKVSDAEDDYLGDP